jgi:predicted O-methyltransferase YrrM
MATGLKKWLLGKLRTATGTQAILERLAAMPAGTNGNGHAQRLLLNNMTVLDGTPYCRYLLPLDYTPSRDFRPRWGYGRPSHAGLRAMFQEHNDDYREVIAGIRRLAPFLSAIPREFQHNSPEPGWLGGAINALDLAVLYYFVEHHRPKTYLEIGSGLTTLFARRAIRDHKLPTRVVSIDPEPRSSIDAVCDQVVRDGMETVDPAIFARLEPGDIVFMDGSHRCFMNSDVTVFMLDVMPLLKPGVIVHVHDILLPDDYPDSFKNWYWNEQYLLAVYLLAAKQRIRTLMPVAFVSSDPELQPLLSPPILDFGPQNPYIQTGGSFWFTHV